MLFSFKQLNTEELTSKVLKDYMIIKNENLDTVVLFQIGDFFETFFEDAKKLSDATGIVLGTRSVKGVGEILQAGFPKHSLSFYIKKLLSEGHRISICEQFQPNPNKKEYLRKVTRKITQGTIIEKEFLDSSANNFILSACQIDKNLYDIAYADVSTGQFYKTNGSYEKIKEEIEKISPSELLVLKKEEELFKEVISKFETTLLDKQYEKNTVDEIILNYCKETQKEFEVKLDKIIEYKIDCYLSMDEITRRCLELTRTRRSHKKRGSLFWFLNYTKTPMGARLLKKYLSEPLLNLNAIYERQKAIEEIINKKTTIKDFETVLECFSDLSRVCAKISNSTISPKDLYQIAKDAEGIKKLHIITNKFISKNMQIEQKWLDDTLEIANRIKNAISKSSPEEIKSGGIIKKGYSPDLDYLNEKIKKITRKISNYEKNQQKNLGIEKLKINYSGTLGYYIEIPSTKQSVVPASYLRKQALANCVRYTTQELKDLEEDILSLKYHANRLEYELFCEIRKMSATFVENIRGLAKEIARIDVLVSLAKCAYDNNLQKPTFNKTTICIQDGFHPSLLKLQNDIVKNPTLVENGAMIILTGANMSGKSTYLKHNAIITLLAQIGSFVPAKLADLTLVDKVFFRQGSTDDIVNNNSTFMVEMNDLKFILDNSTEDSYIFLDEPAKSTNEKEGGAIARAYLEYIIKYKKAKTMLVTHNFELTKLEISFPNIVHNYTIGSLNNTKDRIDRRIKKGIVTSSLALNTAALASLPTEIIQKAKTYLENDST